SRLVRGQVPDAVSIFVLPPSGGELVRRLVGRQSETDEVQKRRLVAARDELVAVREFDYVIVNDDLDASVQQVNSILASERHRISRIAELRDFVQRLVSEVDDHLARG